MSWAARSKFLSIIFRSYYRATPVTRYTGYTTAAAIAMLFADGFTCCDNYLQMTALAGLSPREHTSGTSIRTKVRITKMGGGLIRGKLFMCSFSAKKTNVACTALFDQLVAKGKNKKLALIAVCNKLLK